MTCHNSTCAQTAHGHGRDTPTARERHARRVQSLPQHNGRQTFAEHSSYFQRNAHFIQPYGCREQPATTPRSRSHGSSARPPSNSTTTTTMPREHNCSYTSSPPSRCEKQARRSARIAQTDERHQHSQTTTDVWVKHLKASGKTSSENTSRTLLTQIRECDRRSSQANKTRQHNMTSQSNRKR